MPAARAVDGDHLGGPGREPHGHAVEPHRGGRRCRRGRESRQREEQGQHQRCDSSCGHVSSLQVRGGQIGADATVRRLAEPTVSREPEVLHVHDEDRARTHTVPTRSSRGSTRVNGDSGTTSGQQHLGQDGTGLAGDAAARPGHGTPGRARSARPTRTAPRRWVLPVSWRKPPTTYEPVGRIGNFSQSRLRCPGRYARGQPLADDALEPLLLGRFVQHLPVVVRRGHLPGNVVQAERHEPFATLDERSRAKVVAVEPQQVEGDQRDRVLLGQPPAPGWRRARASGRRGRRTREPPHPGRPPRRRAGSPHRARRGRAARGRRR